MSRDTLIINPEINPISMSKEDSKMHVKHVLPGITFYGTKEVNDHYVYSWELYGIEPTPANWESSYQAPVNPNWDPNVWAEEELAWHNRKEEREAKKVEKAEKRAVEAKAKAKESEFKTMLRNFRNAAEDPFTGPSLVKSNRNRGVNARYKAQARKAYLDYIYGEHKFPLTVDEAPVQLEEDEVELNLPLEERMVINLFAKLVKESNTERKLTRRQRQKARREVARADQPKRDNRKPFSNGEAIRIPFTVDSKGEVTTPYYTIVAAPITAEKKEEVTVNGVQLTDKEKQDVAMGLEWARYQRINRRKINKEVFALEFKEFKRDQNIRKQGQKMRAIVSALMNKEVK